MEDKNALLAKKILDSSTLVSIISIDIDGKINSFNKGAELMLGYEASELIGIETPVIIHDKEEIESYSKFLSSKYGEKIDGLDVFIYLAKLNGSDEREWTYIKKNGDRFTVRLSVTAIKDDETIIGYLGIAKDITEQNSTKNLILNIIDSIPSLIIGIDSNLLITQWNKKAWDITGKPAYEELEKIFLIYTHL